MPRIVSLLPAATEMVAALGLMDQLVARSHECDHPAGVEALPAVTRSTVSMQATSFGIHEQVRAAGRDTLSIFELDAGALARLRPDVVVTQVQCDVCAVGLDEVEEALMDLVDAPTRLVSLEGTTVEGILEDILRVARALGVEARGEALVDALRTRMQGVRAGTRGVRRPTVGLIEWIDPLMAAGNWMPELVDMAGGRSVLGTPGEHSPWMDWSALRALDPDVLIILPCGFDLERTREEMSSLTERSGWESLRSVQSGRVFLVDGNQFFNRPGPRIADSLELLAGLLHPGLFSRPGEGSTWLQWSEPPAVTTPVTRRSA